jgi:hypothetical protein
MSVLIDYIQSFATVVLKSGFPLSATFVRLLQFRGGSRRLDKHSDAAQLLLADFVLISAPNVPFHGNFV